jgi:glycerol-3-phosphate dehydrogenase subunit B
MDSHRFDVIVVGGGVAGLTAAAVAARHGQRVALVATGPSSFVLGNGCVKAGEFTQPSAAHEVSAAIGFFLEMAEAAGCPFAGDVSEQRLLPTILGDFETVALAPRSLWNAEPCNSSSTAIVGIRELSCFDERFMTARMTEQARKLGFWCDYAARQISLAHIFGCSVTTLRIAAKFDSDAAYRVELAGALRLAVPGFDRILVPGILGLHSSGQQLAQFEREVGCSVCELPTLPPSVPGLRLFNRLMGHLNGIGVELFQGFPVQSLRIEDGCCSELQIASPGHPTILHGDCVVVAAGQHSVGLVGKGCAGLDEQMRPVSFDGSVMTRNVFIADSGRHNGSAAEIFFGYRTGNLTAAQWGQYAAK